MTARQRVQPRPRRPATSAAGGLVVLLDDLLLDAAPRRNSEALALSPLPDRPVLVLPTAAEPRPREPAARAPLVANRLETRLPLST